MKNLFSLICLLALFAFSPSKNTTPTQQAITGAWSLNKDGVTHVLLFTNKHYSYTRYAATKFEHTEGGTYTLANGQLQTKLEFNSSDPKSMAQTASHNATVKSEELKLNWPGAGANWKRIDKGGGALNATWRITGREQNGKMGTINRAARKTIKILTGNRFQWAAINTETGEFFGTGGGTYTFKDGVYTETIEFFSRDASRVGVSLSFEGTVDGANWHHRGKSSKGDPIYEIWSKED